MSTNKDKINAHNLPNLETKIYWAINNLSSSSQDRFNPSEIANYLIDQAGISTSRQAVDYVLGKNKKSCHKNKKGYKLMQEGLRLLKEGANPAGIKIINAEQPFTAKNLTLKQILGEKYADLSICDPYVDINTLDVVVRSFKKKVPIRILTAKVVDIPAGIFKRSLGELLNEDFLVEVRLYKSSIIHDRYIITNKELLFSGNSLNYLGKKESFFIKLGSDFKQSILATFNSRWKGSTPV
jgi:hypothetical protein